MINSCIGDIAKNIVLDCLHPNVFGYTGRGVYIPWRSNPTTTISTTNPRVLENVTLPADTHLMYIDNSDPFVASFEGSTTETSTDSGRTLFKKTIHLSIPLRGADVSKDLVEPLLYDTNGGILILEKKAEVADGKYEVIGLYDGIKASGTATRDDVARGSWEIELSSNEVYSECVFMPTGTLQDVKTAFEALTELAF